MRDLFKAEWLHFRGWAIAYALINLLVLGFLSRVLDLAQQDLFVYWIFGSVYALTGLLLGLYQMGTYRRPGAWLNLLHRPLPAWKIAVSMSAASLLLLALAVALPILVIATYQDTMTARVVDTRHWLMPVATLLIAACGYLAGACAMLGDRRYSACGLVVVVWIGLAHASGALALVVQSVALLWLACLLLALFKPDLSAPPRTATATVVTALPVQIGAYMLILLLGFGIEMLWIMQGSHPTNTGTPPPAGHNATEHMTGRQRMLAGLSASNAAQAPLWREQVALADIYGIEPGVRSMPRRNALTNAVQTVFDDGERRIRWVFSHDSMRMEGYGLADGRRVGTLGVGADNAMLPAPAYPAGPILGARDGDNTLIAGNVMYLYDSQHRQLLPRVRLPAGELPVNGKSIGENLAVLSDRALYFFDGRDVVESDGLMTPRQRVPLPGRLGDLHNLDLIELVDGYLVSFSFTERAHDLLGAAPYQTLLRVNDAGKVDVVARRAMSFDYPSAYRYKAWWPSPVLYALRTAAIGLFAAPNPLEATTPPPVPRAIGALAGALMLLSLLAALWMTRCRALSLPARIGWVAACGVIGPPALASLWLLLPARERAAARVQSQLAASWSSAHGIGGMFRHLWGARRNWP